MTKNILFADNLTGTEYEREQLSQKFICGVYGAGSVPSLMDMLTQRNYAVAVVDPLRLTIGAYMEMLSVPERVRDVVRRIRAKEIPVIFAESDLKPETFELEHIKDYQAVHRKPYNVEQLIRQIEEITR